jgi:hypothetical protein
MSNWLGHTYVDVIFYVRSNLFLYFQLLQKVVSLVFCCFADLLSFVLHFLQEIVIFILNQIGMILLQLLLVLPHLVLSIHVVFHGQVLVRCVLAVYLKGGVDESIGEFAINQFGLYLRVALDVFDPWFKRLSSCLSHSLVL